MNDSTAFVPTKQLYAALAGREGEVLDALSISWRAGKPHIACPYPDHADGNPSWRWDQDARKAFCTCNQGDSAIDVIMKLRALDFEAAKLWAAEAIGRADLIRQPGEKRPRSNAESLMNPPAHQRDDNLARAYLAFRLSIEPTAVLMPRTPVAGWRALPYFDPPPAENTPPERVAEPPCAIFAQIGIDGRTHAHRIYLAPGGLGKAMLGNRADGAPRDPKKSARVGKGDRIAGRCALWGHYETAPRVIVAEGIETAAALAFAHCAEIEAGGLSVAAAISAAGVEQFQPWPGTQSIVIAADRDEATKPDGRAGSRRGEQAAVKLARRLGPTHSVSIVMPGQPGESVDWLDILNRDGIESIRAAFRDPLAWAPGRTAPAPEAAEPIEPADSAASGRRGRRFRLDAKGVAKQIEKEDPNTGEARQSWQWFCSPLDVLAATRSDQGEEWGRLIEIIDQDGMAKTWAMPMALLAGDGAAYREKLLSLGLILAPGRFAKEALTEYLATAAPSRRVRCVERIGWHNARYVLPDESFTLSGEAPEEVILQSRAALDHSFKIAGDLGTWRDQLARLAIGNSRLAFSLSCAFAAPLIEPLALEGGGFHLRGSSSVGKSTALIAAGSVWGGGGLRGYVKSWRATDNAMESIAAASCDNLLCLDELAQIAPEAAGAAAYMLAAGAGKQRAGRHGEARTVSEWRVLFLSSGEISLADKIAEAGRGQRAMAGQGVRVIDLPADAGAGLGLFETLHELPGPAELARHLKTVADRNYGIPGRAFLIALVEDLPGAVEAVQAVQASFVRNWSPIGADGQVQRAAQRFGLAAAAGTLATSFGILPWPAGEAIEAAGRCFVDWLHARGGAAPAEEIEGIRAVRRFVEAHGTTRFERLYDAEPSGEVKPSGERANSRAGYREQAADGTEYYVLPEAWKEVCGGYDPKIVAMALRNIGALRAPATGKLQIRKRLPIGNVRCYHLLPTLFDSERDD